MLNGFVARFQSSVRLQVAANEPGPACSRAATVGTIPNLRSSSPTESNCVQANGRLATNLFCSPKNLLGIAAVISNSDRLAAGRWAVDHLKTEVFVLDDGFHISGFRVILILSLLMLPIPGAAAVCCRSEDCVSH